jgi:hypothetical protein
MKLIVLAMAIGLFATGAQAASCNALEAKANQAIASANNADGICNQARALAYALRVAAQYNQQCGSAAQAQEDYNAAQQADETAGASCS